MEAMRDLPLPEKPSAEAVVAPQAEATPSSPAQKKAMSLSAGKTASAEGMESTEEISSPESSIGLGRPSLFYLCSILVPASDGTMLFLVLVSGLYALITPWLLWRVAGQPAALIWTTSLVSFSYSLINTMCLSETTMGSLGVFLRFSCGALLAVAVAHVIGPLTGAATASLVTCYSSGMFGYSIAEYLQRIGIEKSAVAVASLPLFEDEEQQKRRDEKISTFIFLQGIFSMFILARMVWLVLVPGSALWYHKPVDLPLVVVEELSEETILLAWMWSSVVALGLLDQALVSVETMLCKVPICIFVSFVLCIPISIIWDAVSSMVMWTIAMALVGFFGYCLAVYARFRHIQSRNQSVSASSKLSQDGPSDVLDEPNKKLDEADQEPDCCRSLVITVIS